MYMVEKLIEIQQHARRLVEGADQDFIWLSTAAESAKREAERWGPALEGFCSIKKVVVAGGEPAFVLERITKILDKCSEAMQCNSNHSEGD